MSVCRLCQKTLSADEIAIYRRMVNRGAAEAECLCKVCLAADFHVSVGAIDEKIAHFKAMGCTLFSSDPLDR